MAAIAVTLRKAPVTEVTVGMEALAEALRVATEGMVVSEDRDTCSRALAVREVTAATQGEQQQAAEAMLAQGGMARRPLVLLALGDRREQQQPGTPVTVAAAGLAHQVVGRVQMVAQVPWLEASPETPTTPGTSVRNSV